MDTDYDRKFEEMKKYIPFLESMIKRLESTGTTSANPRQAQLAKIRSLRDLLLDKKKRMKMENLLKCEQVLVNLYAKVEQRDSFTDTKSDMNKSVNTQNVELDFVRNKLKTVTSKLQDPETLPEIARASQTEETCTAGSKEPALFQRRPNKSSISPTRGSVNGNRDILSPSGRRSYTRVLVSPERDTKQWPLEKSSDKPLFCRRSPRRTPRKSPRKSPRKTPRKSPRKGSPTSRHKKDRKKSYNQSRTSNKLQDLNITLKVPEESLNSLNTKDILSRIINCSDGDVDIDTLRELRTQILSELKQTGAKDDISDLILKSYKNKKEVGKKKDEVEEGELSDSESEVIESIYGSLVIMDKDQGNTSCEKKSSDKDQPRKIQICLIINSEKENLNDSDHAKDISDQNAVIDESDFESYKETGKVVQKLDYQTLQVENDKNQDQKSNKLETSSTILVAKDNERVIKNTHNSQNIIQKSSDECEEKKQGFNIISESPDDFTPKLYQSQAIINQDCLKSTPSLNLNISSPISTDTQINHNSEQKLNELTNEKDSVEIPLLDLESTAKQEVVHEIDILQALKNEILSEKISIDDSETVTPPLHQPKVTKVANIEGIVSKKRISVEKYKQKSISASKSSTLINDANSNAYRDELSKKQSIKLTEKEFERFNLSSKLALGESSEDEEFGKRSPTIDDIYGDLAPKSPDHEDFADTGIKPPVIIPADPVKTTVVTKADVDMRTLTMQAALSSQVAHKSEAHILSPTGNFDKAFDICKNEVESGVLSNDKRLPLADPRVRRELNLSNTDSPILGNIERTLRSHINFTSNMTPSRMSNIVSNMTPNRMPNIGQSPNIITNNSSNLTSNTNIYEMTPSRQPLLESDDYLKRNHVYAPICSVVEKHDPNDAVSNDFQNLLYSEANPTMFNRLECPQTPMNSFGTSDCPSTPTHTFGLLETPMTPIHTFGRSDMPMTPVPSFGRADCPPTPIHPFGRTEVMMTPSHLFGVTDFSQNQMPSQMSSFRYNKVQDPRINRSSEYDNLSKYNDMKDCKYQERNFNNRNYKYDAPKRAYADSYRNYGREQSVGRNDKNATYEQIENRHGERPRRENSSGFLNRNYEVDRNYSHDRGKAYRDRDHRSDNDGGKIYYDRDSRWNYRREHSVGRVVPENRHIGKHYEREVRPENSLCVQSHAGRSFTIDTSVSRSFQESIENLKKDSISDSNFDVRRRRASSVGRSLIREPSIGKDLPSLGNGCFSVIKSNSNFRRASSVGRDMVKNHDSKNFKDVKKDLQSYKYKSDVKYNDSKNVSSEHSIFPEGKKKINDRDPRLSRRSYQDLNYKNSGGQSLNSYSQKKNYRDPRQRHEFHKEIPKKFHSFQDQARGKSYEFKKHGIIYSSDNIAKGTILGSGYGVKNYKIPKIKRASEETESKELIDKFKPSGSVTNNSCKEAEDVSKDLSTIENIQHKDKTKQKRRSTRWESPDKLNSFKQESEKLSTNHCDSVDKRVTRSAKKNTISEINDFNCESPIKRGNRTSKTVVYDSDTDNVEIDTDKDLQNEKSQDSKEKGKIDTKNNHVDDYINSVKLNNGKKPCDSYTEPANLNSEKNDISQTTKGFMGDEHKEPKSYEPNDISVSLKDNFPIAVTDDTNNCFGMELEMFTDSVAADPVIDNINALIADLDDDLETSKNDGYKNQFTKEITLENMLDNITCMDNKKPVCLGINEQEEIKGIEENKLNDSLSDSNKNVSDLLQTDENNKHKNHVHVISENNGEVSTTENEDPLVQADILSPSKETISQLESCSTPDSTIDLNENTQDKVGEERVPDSTNELACEISSDITSTHDSHEVCEKVQTETSVSRTELTHQTDSIGSLLSILKDKSKIKELLTMLKDQSSENEKLKKKLEKLSEIVSDDDDSPHDESNSVQNEKINISASNNNNEIESAGNSGVHADNTFAADNVSCENNEQSMRNKNNVEEILDVQFKDHEQNATSAENCEGKEPFESTKQNTKNDDDTVEAVSCKKSKNIKKSTKKAKGKVKNITSGDKKRFTRSESANLKMNKPANIKKGIPSRELKQLQDDIKEMFLHDNVFNATGIRMCRLAKLVEDKPIDKGETQNNENSPVVILEKIKECSEETNIKGKTSKKKATSKSKMLQKEVFDTENKTESSNENINSELKLPIKCRPGPKSKTKLLDNQAEVDPYIFESDSVSESNATNISETKPHSSSDSECESLESSKSFGSTELLVELKKKPKRKRRGWQAGVIKPKHKKKKTDLCHSQSDTNVQVMPQIPDLNCFTNKTYCFYKNVSFYSCRLCIYNGNDIVHHYKKQHPHSEIPLSRMSPEVAKEAIEQCEEINFHAISKVTTDKYVCRFCFKEFKNTIKKKTVLEEFFWHVVSMHTGEYKQLCSECINVSRCPFNLDIPPPPKEQKGQLIGYICGKCNFTQISLENLKTHVINRHNDEQTEVYTINLAVMSKKTLLAFSKSTSEQPRTLRSSRLNQSTVETNDEHSDFNESSDNATEPNKLTPIPLKEETLIELQKNKRNKIQSQITFENDDATNELCELNKNKSVKVEQEHVINAQDSTPYNEPVEDVPIADMVAESHETIKNVEYNQPPTSDDILDYPHFKINFTEAGTKEYVCCINGVESHYRTALLISFKKHVQIKHTEKWDGFCFLCKLIVTPQGNHNFKDCLQHFLDKHFDNFPTMEKVDDKKNNMETSDVKSKKNYLNVRPLSELISQSEIQPEQPKLPIIESVVSLGGSTDEASSGINVDTAEIRSNEQEFKYEEAQAEITAKKYKVVLDVMMNREKLVHIFKCAGRFCSYSTDNAEDALRHAVTHERVGGENSLSCTYCDFDSSKNAVDLVTHVFKTHGCCQYVCGHCFYRSAASQLVRAHASRIHGKAPGQSVILRTTVTARSDTECKILPREIAVPFFACNQNVMDAKCKFKTYTSGKFYEHLQIRHQLDISFLCFMCSEVFTKPVDLLQHFKIHGFKLYQCTWCVHGAENETELLAHASEKHPNKQPQAYLRVITNKEGTPGFRVLPLAHLNNSNITTIDVKPNNVRNNPEKEAERSIDLENLIGQTTQMIESMVTSSQNESTENCTFNEQETISMPLFEPVSLSQTQSQESLVLALQSSLFDKTPETSISTDVGPAPISADLSRPETPNLASQPINSDVHNQLTPVLKGEPEPNTPEKTDSDVVYCLDSDEETSNENVVDLSSEESPLVAVVNDKSGKLEKVPLSRLFKCSLCSMILKSTSGFKRHVSACHTEATNLLPCAYCPFVAQRDLVAKHYLSDHCLSRKEATRSYVCGVCNNKYISFTFVKTHLKDDHNLSKLVVTSKLVTNGEYQFVVSEASKQKQVAKRKLSNDNEDKSLQPVSKMKKFGPNDVNLLPINPILDELVYCSLCEFSTKVRLNMVRHLQLHAEQQPVPQTAPVNPVPHLETNEKHFDKMVNLASSSIASRAPEKLNKTDRQQVVNLLIPPEAASRYPKYVPDRQRYTCGAKGCCYISVDETMLKYHWETLHSGTNDFHCVHCPPYQHLDTTKPLTACRIIAHLKMHDVRLYACSSCSYYHHRRQVLDKHIAEIHSTGHVMVVREESVSQTLNVTQPSTVAPTMDLKPWQCGLCKFKSMLRPEVVEHCAKIHQSKMQYKCTYCAFRTSTLENITKHQSKSHAGKAQETFYFYYREGSIPDEPDGTPRWQKQRQKSSATETEVKTETIECTDLESQSELTKNVPQSPARPTVDLNIVKQDPDAVTVPAHTTQDLCKTFGQFCEPNGLKYKCPLCKNTLEDSRDAMQSHLYEELQCRKWGCGFCSYKAFHKNGLNDHMLTEHRNNREPIELPVDVRAETWIAKLLDHQFLLIEKNKQNLTKQSIAVIPVNSAPTTSKSQDAHMNVPESDNGHSEEELEKMFGTFGTSENKSFNCPKCSLNIREESAMRDHLEIELNKIRWCCNSCTEKFQNYHEAQFHCKSVHPGITARAIEAVRDVGMRSAWISAVMRAQKLSMNHLPVTENTDSEETIANSLAQDNSLLVVRYEERVPTPDIQVIRSRTSGAESDEDEEKLVIDEVFNQVDSKQCPFCIYTCQDIRELKQHVVGQHNNIKPYFCFYCDFNGYRKTVVKHVSQKHKDKPLVFLTKGQRILGCPTSANAVSASAPVTVEDDATRLICLRCEKPFNENEAKTHFHDNTKATFAKTGQTVVKCRLCSTLHENIDEAAAHHHTSHPNKTFKYITFKLHCDKRSIFSCAYCDQNFSVWADLKVHWRLVHSSLPFKFNKGQCAGTASDVVINVSDDEETGVKRKSESILINPSPSKMCARKSTTKLPIRAVAKKSTTKLPFNLESDSDSMEYSFYGSKPQVDDLDNVTTNMSFCNTVVPFTFKKLSEVIRINPTVLVEDIKK